MPTFRVTVRLGAIALAAALLLGPGPATAGTATAGTSPVPAKGAIPAKGILPPKHPARDVNPSPNFFAARSCQGGGDSATCNAIVLRAITHARSVLEKIGGMSFSLAAYEKLTPVEQLFVTANLERVERGLSPVVVLTRSLDKIAQAGAVADQDPDLRKVPGTLPGGGHWVKLGGNWAGGFDNALGSDYGWMYLDKGSAWGHRDNIIGGYFTASSCRGARREIAMGAGHVRTGEAFGDSETELFAGICGPTPTDAVITWAKAKTLLHIK
jgi:hypothetical protein